MIKRKTIETVEEYDANGKLLRKVTTETDNDVNENVYPISPFAPYYPWDTGAWWGIYPPYYWPYISSKSVPEYKITIGDTPGSCGSGSTSSASASSLNVNG